MTSRRRVFGMVGRGGKDLRRKQWNGLKSETQLRNSINKWGAHLTWQRAQPEPNKGSRPKRRRARTVAAEVLEDAMRFVDGCVKNGFQLDQTAAHYLARCKALS